MQPPHGDGDIPKSLFASFDVFSKTMLASSAVVSASEPRNYLIVALAFPSLEIWVAVPGDPARQPSRRFEMDINQDQLRAVISLICGP